MLAQDSKQMLAAQRLAVPPPRPIGQFNTLKMTMPTAGQKELMVFSQRGISRYAILDILIVP